MVNQHCYRAMLGFFVRSSYSSQQSTTYLRQKSPTFAKPVIYGTCVDMPKSTKGSQNLCLVRQSNESIAKDEPPTHQRFSPWLPNKETNKCFFSVGWLTWDIGKAIKSTGSVQCRTMSSAALVSQWLMVTHSYGTTNVGMVFPRVLGCHG